MTPRGYRPLVPSPGVPPAATRAALDAVPLWYHTLELPGGVLTPGWFDLRRITDRLPWPDVRDRRCLDVATYDGFYAFELERRGAMEVVATDIPDHTDWDWPARARARGGPGLRALAGEKGRGFELARQALGSSVRKEAISVYDLSPEAVGRFDLVVCGSLLLHLRDPVRALEAIRSVCSGLFLSVEAISLPLTLLSRSAPVAMLSRRDDICQWWTPNPAGHRRLLEAAGFQAETAVGPFAEPFGVGHPAYGRRPSRLRGWIPWLTQRLLLGGVGVPHTALLARPRADLEPISPGSPASL